MIGLQPGHIVIIILVAILLFVPTRLPQLVRGFKGMFSQFRDEVRNKSRSKNTAADTSTKPKS